MKHVTSNLEYVVEALITARRLNELLNKEDRCVRSGQAFIWKYAGGSWVSSVCLSALVDKPRDFAGVVGMVAPVDLLSLIDL